ncbi:MAG: tRNA adenosine(34) deaminase TadA [Cellvibrionaceae bacterium]
MSQSEVYTDEYWMQQALMLAEKAAVVDEVPVGALVVKDNKVVAEGWNQPITTCDPTAHAEIIALRAAGQALGNYRLPGCTLYVTIEPCSMCAGAIVHSRMERVVFGAAEPKAGAVVSNGCFFEGPHLNHVVAYLGGVLEEACSAQISAFFSRRRAEKKAAKRSSNPNNDSV